MVRIGILAALCAGAWLRGDTGLIEAIRRGDTEAVRRLAPGGKVNTPDAGGITPLMHAVVCGDAAMIEVLLEAGADARAMGPAGATALHWAAHDVAKARLLINRGAPVHARSNENRTPLTMAALRAGSAPVVRLLLEKDRGATQQHLAQALSSAAFNGDLAAMRLLMAAGAPAGGSGTTVPVINAALSRCVACVRLLLEAKADVNAGNGSGTVALHLAARNGDLEMARLLLDRGAAIGKADRNGRTALHHSIRSDYSNPSVVALLVARGADPKAKSNEGETILSDAERYGDAEILKLLGKTAGEAGGAIATGVSKVDSSEAIRKSVALLQRSGPAVFRNRGCVSCHNNTLPAMVVDAARRRGFAVDEATAASEARAMRSVHRPNRGKILEGTGVGGGIDTASHVLLGMHASGQPRDELTDALAHMIAARQGDDGRWRTGTHRPPQEHSDIALTARSLRGIQLYLPPGRAGEREDRILRARKWLASATPTGVEEEAHRLLGLAWGHEPAREFEGAAEDLLRRQHANGGWSQLPSLPQDSYATGLALYALRTAGLAVTDARYRRGVEFLLRTQLPDGSWFVRSRAIPFQPYFESGYPHGHDQWISAAGASWATLALLEAIPPASAGLK